MCVCVGGGDLMSGFFQSHLFSRLCSLESTLLTRGKNTICSPRITPVQSDVLTPSRACFARLVKRYDFKRREQIFPHLLFLFMYLLSCRWTWRLCRSSFRRWPSGTRASPAPARGRTDSREGSAPSASWTTGWQRLAWTDKGKQHESFM